MTRINKFVIVFLTVAISAGSIFGFTPKQAQAQLVVAESGPVGVTLIPSLVLGVGTPGAGNSAIAAAKSLISSTCNATIIALGKAESVEALSTLLDTSSSAAFNIIGGGAVEATKISGKIVRATAAKECVDTYIAALSEGGNIAGSVLGLSAAVPIGTEIDRFGKVSAALQQIIESLQARQSASVKDILKAFMVKLVLNLNKNLTTGLVNKMVDKYKISDYLAYGDALTTQVYSMKYINDNFKGDARQQMIIRSLLQSEKTPDKIKTAQAFASSKAQDYLGEACGVSGTTGGSQDLNSYIKCLAAYGSPEASAQYHYLQGIDQAQAATSAGRASANSEIAQSNGFAPPRNCLGTLDAQKQIDTQYDKVGTDLRVATIAKATLQNALNMKPPKTTQAEYQKAVDAEAQAKANEKALKSQVSNPIVDICESIATPASFVSTSIGDFLKQHLDQTSQLKSDNLPFYASFLSDVASNFLTNILTGGKSGSQVLKEAGTAALGSALGGLIGSIPIGGAGGGTTQTPGKLVVYAYDPAVPDSGRVTSLVPGKSYVIMIDFVELIFDKPYKIKVDGGESSIAPINKVLTNFELGEERIKINYKATQSPFDLSVVLYTKDAAGKDKIINSSIHKFTVSGIVKGASVVLPRGPAISLR